jgi:hypothetical protein
MSPNAGGCEGDAGSQPMSTAVHNAHGAQINFGDLTLYLAYDIRPRTEEAAPGPDDTNIKRRFQGPEEWM